MKTTDFIYRNAFYLFLTILAASILVFGAQYIMRASAGAPVMPLGVFHGATAGLWCVLITAQAWLIRQHKRGVHRALGKSAYVLGPLVAFSILWLSLDVLRYSGIQTGSLYILSVRVFLFVAFTGFLVMALARRRRPDVHARWMICSAAVMLDPILSRVSFFLHPVPWTTGFHQYVAFGIMNLVVLWLAALDWRERRKDVFLVALVLMLSGQAAALALWDTAAFHSFAEWFIRIPLPRGY